MKKTLKIVFLVLGLAVAGLGLALPLKNAALGDVADIRAELVQNKQSEFATLPDGVIGYTWHGPENGPVVVLVHGFSMARYVFDLNVPALTGAGYRVLTYDHYGRGSSDRPDLTYNADLFDRELVSLLDALGVQAPVNLLGYSMGGGIATVFASRHPERVRKLALMAPVGFMPEPSGSNALLLVPVVGDWLMGMIGERVLVGGLEETAAAGTTPPYFVDRFREQFRYRGCTRALLSSMRNYPMGRLKNEYETVARLGIPTLLIWGSLDAIVPFAGNENVRAAIPAARFVKVDSADHDVPYSHPDLFNRTLLDFLK